MTTFVHGAWNVICDRCGFEYKNRELRRQWDGLMVCRKCYDVRHPQESLRGKSDRQTPPWTRPEQDGTDVSVGSGNEVSADDL